MLGGSMEVPERFSPDLDPPSCRFCGTVTTCESTDELSRQEVYIGMIKSCYGIDVTLLEGAHESDSLVCPNCIRHLRDAINFKICIIQGEQAIEQRMNRANAGSAELNKGPPEEQAQNEEMADGLDDQLNEQLLHEYYALGSLIDMARKADISPPESMRGYSSDGSAGSLVCRRVMPLSLPERPAPERLRPERLEPERPEYERPEHVFNLDGGDQPFMQTANTAAIVMFSYVCPFKNRFNHIKCYYCEQYFLDPEKLRDHTMEHDVKDFRPVRYGYTKVDLSRIDCRLCSQQIDNLKDLKRHLISHGKKYYLESKEFLLPFKLAGGGNRCALCGEQFSYFYGLFKHMTQHFSNYICETCGVGFMNEASLQKHGAAHDGKRYTCDTCGKHFKTEYTRLVHVRRVHDKSAGSFCTKCDAFLKISEKAKHMVEVHGESPTVPCLGCDQVFRSRRLLTVHVRREHMKDYRYECSFCHKKFFTKWSLAFHMPTHTGERKYKCKVCEKSYPRLKTLKEHMKIHSNDRRYRCHICGKAFIQNCSLKGHLKNKHPNNE